jgi:hypothetical protein
MQAEQDLELLSYMNLSIVVIWQKTTKEFKKWIQISDSIRKGNLLELIIILNNEKKKVIAQSITKAKPGNIKLIVTDTNDLQTAYFLGTTNASFSNILLVSPNNIPEKEMIYTGLKLLNNFKNAFFLQINASRRIGVSQSILVNKRQFSEISLVVLPKSDVKFFFSYIRQSLILKGLQEKYIDDFSASLALGSLSLIVTSRLRKCQINTKQSQSISSLIQYQKIHDNEQGNPLKKKLRNFRKFPFDIPNKQNSIICLLQVRNEADIINETLAYLDELVDGIILLDDDSTDNTYELAVSSKLLCKGKKEAKAKFDDLANRNLLLEMASFYKSDWLLFLDADERLHKQYNKLREIIKNTKADVLEFKCVHVWNDPQKYRVDIPEGVDGIMSRPRMFRHKGWMQIYANREIYFPAVPFFKNMASVPIVIVHYGLMNVTVRERKYELYKKQDKDGAKQGYTYEYLLDKAPILEKLSSIEL